MLSNLRQSVITTALGVRPTVRAYHAPESSFGVCAQYTPRGRPHLKEAHEVTVGLCLRHGVEGDRIAYGPFHSYVPRPTLTFNADESRGGGGGASGGKVCRGRWAGRLPKAVLGGIAREGLLVQAEVDDERGAGKDGGVVPGEDAREPGREPDRAFLPGTRRGRADPGGRFCEAGAGSDAVAPADRARQGHAAARPELPDGGPADRDNARHRPLLRGLRSDEARPRPGAHAGGAAPAAAGPQGANLQLSVREAPEGVVRRRGGEGERGLPRDLPGPGYVGVHDCGGLCPVGHVGRARFSGGQGRRGSV